MRLKIALLTILIVASLSAWSNPVSVSGSSAGKNFFPQIVSDAYGGAFISWLSKYDDCYEVYIQRVDANGSIHTGWSLGGERVSVMPDADHIGHRLNHHIVEGWYDNGGQIVNAGHAISFWANHFDIRSQSIQQTSDGGYIVVGGVVGYPSKLALLKTNINGDSLWMHTYLLNDWYASWGYYGRETFDKGFIATGLIWDTLYGNERYALWLVKTDSVGDTLWTYRQGGENWGDWEDGRYVFETSEGDFMVLARTGLLKVRELSITADQFDKLRVDKFR